ncbi:MAG: hypothetical protein HOV80_15395 [Polyangiaceae bacterium]|nr:hypothetical protein [Polyangiaceae bacterium]
MRSSLRAFRLAATLVGASTALSCAAFNPTRCAPIRRADGIGSCVDIRMTEQEAAYIDELKANEPRETRISTAKENCDHWIEAFKNTPETMPGARAYIDKTRFERCQDAMHGELAGRKAEEREREEQAKRDEVGKTELTGGCSQVRQEDLEKWAAKLKTSMATKLRHRKCWMQAGLKLCDREAGFDVFTFEPKKKAVGVARPKDVESGAPFSIELEAPAQGKELHVLAFGYSPPSIRIDGATADGASPFEDKASMTEKPDGYFEEIGDVPRPHHRTSQVVRSGKPTVTVDGLGCTLVVVFEGGMAPPPGKAKDDTW